MEGDIPALLRKCALELCAGRPEFPYNCLHHGPVGVVVPLKVNVLGHCVLGVATFDIKVAPPECSSVSVE